MTRLGWFSLLAVLAFVPLPRNRNDDVFLQANPQGTDQIDASCADEKNFSKCFHLLRMAHGATSDHFIYSENTYEGPDSATIYSRIVHYASHDRAAKEFQDKVKSAVKVLDKARAPNDEGQDDELAVLVLDDKPERGDSIVVAVSGKDFLTTQSKSSQDVLIIANQMKQHVMSEAAEGQYKAPR